MKFKVKISRPAKVYLAAMGASVLFSSLMLDGSVQIQVYAQQAIREDYLQIREEDPQLALAELSSAIMAQRLGFDIKVFLLITIGLFGIPALCLTRILLLPKAIQVN